MVPLENLSFIGCWSNCRSIFIVLVLLIMIADDVTLSIPVHSQRFSAIAASAPGKSIEELDRQIQMNAFQSFKRSRTGEIYTVTLPSNLTGIKVEAVRLRSGSLRRHGLVFNEFSIPTGASVEGGPQSERVLLIYREFTGLNIFSLEGYMLVAPVLGIKIYSAWNLFTQNAVPDLQLTAPGATISVRIPFSGMAPRSAPLCVFLHSNGSMTVTNITSPPNVCSSSHLGDFSLVIPSAPAPSPAPHPSLAPRASPSAPKSSVAAGFSPTGRTGNHRSVWKIAVGSAVAAFAVVALMGALALMVAGSVKKTRIAKMEYESEQGETLQTALIGNSRAPTAGSARTRPSLENDYTP